MPPNSLEEVLDLQAGKLEELLGASEALQHAVIHNDHEALKSAMEKMNEAQTALGEVEQARLSVLAQEGKADATLREYIDTSQPPRRETLDSLFSRISTLVLHLKRMQEANTMLLREGLSYIQVQLSAATPKKTNAGVYGRTGTFKAFQGAALDTVG